MKSSNFFLSLIERYVWFKFNLNKKIYLLSEQISYKIKFVVNMFSQRLKVKSVQMSWHIYNLVEPYGCARNLYSC